MESYVLVHVLKNITSKKLTEIYESVNSGTKIKTHELVWAIRNEFNIKLKEKSLNSGITGHMKTKDILSKERNAYKFLLKALKVCSKNQNIGSIDNQTTDCKLKKFIEKNYPIDIFEYIFKCVNLMVHILDQYYINESNEDYKKYQILFIIHILKMMDYEIEINKIVHYVNSFDKNDVSVGSRVSVHKRYDELLKKIQLNDGNFRPKTVCVENMEG